MATMSGIIIGQLRNVIVTQISVTVANYSCKGIFVVLVRVNSLRFTLLFRYAFCLKML